MPMKLSDGDFKRLAGIIKAKYGLNLFEKKFLVESVLQTMCLTAASMTFQNILKLFTVTVLETKWQIL